VQSPATARPDRRRTFRRMLRSSMRPLVTTSRICRINQTGRGPTIAGSTSPTFCPELDVSMLESMLTLTLPELQLAQFNVPPPSRYLFGPVATAGGFVSLAIASERTFQGLAAAASRLDWLTDPRFADYADRRANWDKLMDELEIWSKKLSNADCLKALDANGVPAATYRTVREAMNDLSLYTVAPSPRCATEAVRSAS
jgi:crotonobetainyl-CoA:carnitine CoA-transferase CaiB-like acyl-CoA transferase